MLNITKKKENIFLATEYLPGVPLLILFCIQILGSPFLPLKPVGSPPGLPYPPGVDGKGRGPSLVMVRTEERKGTENKGIGEGEEKQRKTLVYR